MEMTSETTLPGMEGVVADRTRQAEEERRELVKQSSEELIAILVDCGIEIGMQHHALRARIKIALIRSILLQRTGQYRIPKQGDVAIAKALPGQSEETTEVIPTMDLPDKILVRFNNNQQVAFVSASSLTFVRRRDD